MTILHCIKKDSYYTNKNHSKFVPKMRDWMKQDNWNVSISGLKILRVNALVKHGSNSVKDDTNIIGIPSNIFNMLYLIIQNYMI